MLRYEDDAVVLQEDSVSFTPPDDDSGLCLFCEGMLA